MSSDHAAEEELAARFRPRIEAFVAARTSRVDLIEEVTQETLIGVIQALRAGRVRDVANLSSYVLGIARNQFADALRKEARRRTTSLPDGFDVPAPPAVRDPELVEAARREIDNLDTVDRHILWMTMIEGFKPGELALSLGMSAELVRQRKSRAMKKVVEKLRPVSCSESGGRQQD